MSDTPRTDAFDGCAVGLDLCPCAEVIKDHARQLERELATATACAKFPEATLEAIESLKRELAEARRWREKNADQRAARPRR